MSALYRVHIDGDVITRVADTHHFLGRQLLLMEKVTDPGDGDQLRVVLAFNSWDYVELEYSDG